VKSRARIELVIQEAEQAFCAVPMNPVLNISSRPLIVCVEYPIDQAAVQLVLAELGASLPIYCDVASTCDWPVDQFRSWVERLRDQLIERGYQLHRVQSGTPQRLMPDTFKVMVQSAVQASSCWSQYRDALHAHSTAQTEAVPLGKQLEALRKEARWTVEQLAENVQLDRSSVQDHLSGKTTPRRTNLLQYEAKFSARLNRPVRLDA
jgi:hypothetical protein